MAKIDPAEIARNSGGVLKKIVAAKGNIEGNFYLCEDAASSDDDKVHGLALTLLSKDPTGAKAFQLGKALKKELQSKKSLRGKVRFDAPQLVFESHAGNLDGGAARKLLKQLAELDASLKVLKKAIFRDAVGAGADAADGAVPETAPDPDSALSAEEIQALTAGLDAADIQQLIADQQSLGDLNERLEGFLSLDDDALAEELAASIEETLQALRQALDGADPDAAKRLRQELAAKIWVGEDPFPAPGEPLSAPLRETLQLSIDSARQAFEDYLQDYRAQMENLHREVLKMPESARQDNALDILGMVERIRSTAQALFQQLGELSPEPT